MIDTNGVTATWALERVLQAASAASDSGRTAIQSEMSEYSGHAVEDVFVDVVTGP